MPQYTSSQTDQQTDDSIMITVNYILREYSRKDISMNSLSSVKTHLNPTKGRVLEACTLLYINMPLIQQSNVR